MKDKQSPWEQTSYETGSTRPPKSRVGLAAVLLVAVILLCGISTAFSLLNIRLSLEQQHSDGSFGISFSGTYAPSEPAEATVYAEDPTCLEALGLCGQGLSELEQRYYLLPPGFWITEVYPGSEAAKLGLRRGDILLEINGNAVTDGDSIREILQSPESRERILLKLQREGESFLAELALAGKD